MHVTYYSTYLTSIDKEERGNASKLLASVIDQHSNFPAAEVEHLSDFFCDRIKDHHSIVPHVLTAFSALVGTSGGLTVYFNPPPRIGEIDCGYI